MKRSHVTAYILGGTLAAAFTLRLSHIGDEPLWGDEILSLDIFTHFESYREMIRYVREVEFHPPLYYILMKAWTGVFGTSNLAIRLPSVICSTAAIGVVFAIARKMFASSRAALAAAGLMAVFPIQMEYGQEARPYAMVVLAAAFAFHGLWTYATTDRRTALVTYAVASTIGLYLHYSFLFPLVGFAAWGFADALREKELRGRRLFELFVAHGAIAIAFSWWLPALLTKVFLGKFTILGVNRGHLQLRKIGSFENLLPQLIWFKEGLLITKIELVSQILAVLTASALAISVLRRNGEAVSAALSRDRRALMLCASVFVITLVLFLVSSLSELDGRMFCRYVITASVAIVLAAGALVAAVPWKRGAAFLAVLLASLIPTGSLVLANDGMWNPSFKVEEAVSYVNEHIKENEIFIVNRVAWRTNINHYLRPDVEAITFIPLAHYGTTDSWSSRATLGIMENEGQIRARRIKGDEIKEKMERLIELHQPTGVWLYWFDEDARAASEWFKENGWHHGFRSMGPLFPIDHYVKK